MFTFSTRVNNLPGLKVFICGNSLSNRCCVCDNDIKSFECRSQTTFGRSTLNTSQELDRIQEKADKTAAELRRAQAELRVAQVDNERARSEATGAQEKVEKLQGEVSYVLDFDDKRVKICFKNS